MNIITRTFVPLLTAVGLMLGSVSVAQAVPVPPDLQLQYPTVGAAQNPTAKVVAAGTFSFTDAYGRAPVAGTYIRVTVTSCGQYIQQAAATMDGASTGLAVWFSPTGASDLSPNSVNVKVGKSFEFTAEIVTPGFDAYAISGSYNGYAVTRPSCDEIINGETPSTGSRLVVKKWSKKVSLARTGTKAFVGKKVRITKTVSNGRETYQWKVGKKVVKQGGLKFAIKKSYKGKKISVRAIASKGNEAKTRTLSFGRAKR